MRSFEKLNYTTRPNKNVERKLLAQILRTLGSTGHFKMSEYRYIGLGSIWFADFALFHRLLGITDMISVEKERSREKRLVFNKPFDCINLKLGEYSEVFPDLTWEKQTVAWLDYDDTLKPYLFDDLKRTLQKVGSGSLVFVTVNADSWQLQNVKAGETLLTESEALNYVCTAENLPPEYEKKLGRAQFPALVGEIIEAAFKNVILSERQELEFRRMVNLTYADHAPMVTYGGIVLDGTDLTEFDRVPFDALSFLRQEEQFELAVPHLTPKEKMVFDQLLPSGSPPQPNELDFELRAREIESYWRFYLQYPVFGEYHF